MWSPSNCLPSDFICKLQSFCNISKYSNFIFHKSFQYYYHITLSSRDSEWNNFKVVWVLETKESHRARAHQGNWQPQRNCNFWELLSAWVQHMLLNGAVEIEETALLFPEFVLLYSTTCVQVRLITISGNCDCVAVASFLRVPSPIQCQFR
jgi:hypothetical protein